MALSPQCCNHPYLFEGAEPGPPYFTGEHLMENAGKMVLMDKLLPRLKDRDSRVLIFSQMTRMLDILEDYMQYRGYEYCRIDGNTNGVDRESAIDVYNAPDSRKFVFLLSTRAGGLGINLATADVVIIYDSDWNPQMDLQAMDRAHRIGQKKEVQVFRFMTEDSVEAKVIEKAYKKLALDALIIQQGRLQEAKSTLGKDDLLQMVKYGAEKIFSGAGATITDEDIDAIIAKGLEETKTLSDKLNVFKEHAVKFTMEGDTDLYAAMGTGPALMEGGDIPEGLDLKNIVAANWQSEPGRRAKKNATYNDNEYYRQQGAMAARASKPSGPKLSHHKLDDFKFFNVDRLKELNDKEDAWIIWDHTRKGMLDAAAARNDTAFTLPEDLAVEPPQLSEEEIAEREVRKRRASLTHARRRVGRRPILREPGAGAHGGGVF